MASHRALHSIALFTAGLLPCGSLQAQQAQPATTTASPAEKDSCGAGLAGTPSKVLSDNMMKNAHNAADAVQIQSDVSGAKDTLNEVRLESHEGIKASPAEIGGIFSAKDDIKAAHGLMDKIKGRNKSKDAPPVVTANASPCTTTHFIFNADAHNSAKATLVLSSNEHHVIDLDQAPGNANLYKDGAGNTFLIAPKTDNEPPRVTVIPAPVPVQTATSR